MDEIKKYLDIINNDIIDVDGAADYKEHLMDKAIEILMSIHPYKISQLKGGDNRYQTYVAVDGKKRQLKANSKRELQKKLISIYCIDEHQYTLETYFDKVWYPLYMKQTRKRETAVIRKQNFEKYVRGTKLGTTLITKITADTLEEWSIPMIMDNNLTRSCWNNYKYPVTAMLKKAVKAGIIKSNPWDKVEIQRNLFRSKRKKEAKYMIFYLDEVAQIIDEAKRSYNETRNPANYAIIINFELGLRVGELVALKYTDFDFKNDTVRIERQESDGIIEEYVKSDSAEGYRTLPVSKELMRYVKELQLASISEYVFFKDGKRMSTRKISHRLEKIQKNLKYGYNRDTHCMRRTVASKKQLDGIPIDEIRKWLGHTDVQTTYRYLYNITREDKTADWHRSNSILAV